MKGMEGMVKVVSRHQDLVPVFKDRTCIIKHVLVSQTQQVHFVIVVANVVRLLLHSLVFKSQRDRKSVV